MVKNHQIQLQNFNGLPQDWRVKRLKYLTTSIKDGTHGSFERIEDGVPLLSAKNIKNGGIFLSNEESTISEDDYNAINSNGSLQHGDLLLTIVGSIGRAAIYHSNLKAAFQRSVAMLRVSFELENKYLFYLTQSDFFQNQLSSNTKKNIQGGIYLNDLSKLYVIYPRLVEQRRISKYLDQSCTRLDAIIAIKRQQLGALDQLRKSTISKAVTTGLSNNQEFFVTNNVWITKLPLGWQLINLKRLSVIQTGLTLGKTYENHVIERPYLRVANVQDGHLDLSELTMIEVPAELAARVTLKSGDVLMTEGGDLDKLGRGTVWNGEVADCLHQNHIFAVRCFKHKLLPEFLAYLTASNYGRDYFEATGKRTTNLASTNSTKVGQFPIPLPPLSEQREICTFLDDKLNNIGKISDGIQKQIDTLIAYRKSLIHECVTGQRRITEADLQRVQAHEHN